MKTISLLAAMFLIALSASPAVAGRQVPFNGSFTSNETYDVQFPVLFVDGTATGNANQLGRYTATYEEQVDLFTGSQRRRHNRRRSQRRRDFRDPNWAGRSDA